MNRASSSRHSADGFSGFGEQLRGWRRRRSISQLDLALEASVSQRHVSWLETGRSHPSRQMVVQLADALDIPLRERNTLLSSAGFVPLYAETSLQALQMQPVLDALSRMLEYHLPMPAIVIDRLWHVQMTNQASDRLLELIGGDAIWSAIEDHGKRSLARLTLHPNGLRPMIENWEQAAPAFMHRIRREAQASGSATERREYESLLALVSDVHPSNAEQDNDLLPILPLTLRFGDLRLSLFSVIATFGTPQDVTVDELRIESFFAADEATGRFFEQLANTA